MAELELTDHPIVFTNAGDVFTQPTQIQSIVWEASSTANDVALLVHRVSGKTIWKGRATATSTYKGITFAGKGLSAPTGIRLETHDSTGTVMVYKMVD